MESTTTSATVRTGGFSIVLAALVLGASFVVSAAIFAKTYYKAKALTNIVAVTGSAEKLIASDTVKWSSNFSRTVTSEEIKSGAAQMKSDLGEVVALFHGAGVIDHEITIDPVTVTPICDQQFVRYDRFGNQSCALQNPSYQLQQNVRVESTRVDEVTVLAQDAVKALIDKGVLFTSNNVEYYYSKLADLKVQLFADATKDAQARAAKVAESTGATLGPIQAVSTGVLQVTAVNSTDISDYGSYDTSAREKKVTSVVHASFLLQ